MQCEKIHGECLELGRRFGGLVDLRAEVVEERVDEEGSEVFDYVDRSPINLRACVINCGLELLVHRLLLMTTSEPKSLTLTVLRSRRPV